MRPVLSREASLPVRYADFGHADRSDASACVSTPPAEGSPVGMTAERDDPGPRDDLDELDELIDEFGDRRGPDPTREPELELGEDEVIFEPAPDEEK